MQKANKLGEMPIKKLIWAMGLPMIISMVLQALYNVVDTAFIINMPVGGEEGNLALTYSFPVQIFMIALGVGLGIGVNALLSHSLGQGDGKTVSKAAGNGMFIAFIFFLVFLLFGLFGGRYFIAMQASSIAEEAKRATVIEYGSTYLMICCCFSLGNFMYTVFERFLQATGRTMLSTIAQISGALTNIILDYVFIYPLDMGIAGAAYATVIGQFVSFLMCLLFHFLFNKEIGKELTSLLPKRGIIKQIFLIGIPAMVMQGLLSVMMLGMTMIIGTGSMNTDTLQGAFGIYYKIMQIALFACFGMSNALITIIAYASGKGEKERVKQTIIWGIVDTLIVSLAITIIFESLAGPIASLFGMASGEGGEEIVSLTKTAIRIGASSYLFMAFTLAIQGLLQGLRYVWTPLLLSALRLVVFLFPSAFLSMQMEDPSISFWLSFLIAEGLTAVASFIFILKTYRKQGRIEANGSQKEENILNIR